MITATSLKAQILVVLAGLLVTRAGAQQSVSFDFDVLPQYSSLPAAYTVSGITAQLSASGQGFSIQAAGVLGFTPVGFSGLCIYPNSVYAADLIVTFSTPLTDFSILYAPEEYACDISATMRVTADMNGTFVGTRTTNAQAGTWPTETLRFTSTNAFNHVVIHYDAPPSGAENWGPIFMADNMAVTPALLPVVLASAVMLDGGGVFQFAFTNWPGSTFTILAATNPAQPPASWSVLGAPTEITPGYYQCNDFSAMNFPARFYRVRSP